MYVLVAHTVTYKVAKFKGAHAIQECTCYTREVPNAPTPKQNPDYALVGGAPEGTQ